LFPINKDDNLIGAISLQGPGLDKGKDDKGYFGYGGMSPNMDDEEEDGTKKSKGTKKGKKGTKKQTSELGPSLGK
jgi:hypothetical protein